MFRRGKRESPNPSLEVAAGLATGLFLFNSCDLSLCLNLAVKYAWLLDRVVHLWLRALCSSDAATCGVSAVASLSEPGRRKRHPPLHAAYGIMHHLLMSPLRLEPLSTLTLFKLPPVGEWAWLGAGRCDGAAPPFLVFSGTGSQTVPTVRVHNTSEIAPHLDVFASAHQLVTSRHHFKR